LADCRRPRPLARASVGARRAAPAGLLSPNTSPLPWGHLGGCGWRTPASGRRALTLTMRRRTRGSWRCVRNHRLTGRRSASTTWPDQPPLDFRQRLGAEEAPERQRVDYNRTVGHPRCVRRYDLLNGRLRVRLRPKPAGTDGLSFVRQTGWPTQLRNLVRAIRLFAAANKIELSRPRLTPANSTRLNATPSSSTSSSSQTPTTWTGTHSVTRLPHQVPKQRPTRPRHRRRGQSSRCLAPRQRPRSALPRTPTTTPAASTKP